MKKEFLCIMLLALSTIVANAQECFISDGINYAIDEEAPSEVYVIPLDDEKYMGNIVIPATVQYKDKTYNVTSIGRHSFYNCQGLISIKLPESITYIGTAAFQYCKNLSQIILPSKLDTIKSFAFSYCTKITKVVIPNSVKTIEASAFSDCTGLTSVTIGTGLETIDSNTFTQCTALKTITIPATVKRIKDKAFSGSGLTTVTFLGKTTQHTDYAFSSTPWFTMNSQRTKDVMKHLGRKIKTRNMVTY